MQLSTKHEGYLTDNQTWLGSAHGTDVARTVTIDYASVKGFDGVIPSGIPLKRLESGKYGPVDAAEDELAGFLLTPQSVSKDGVDVVAPLLDHGRIRVANLPDKAFKVETLDTKPGSFVFIEEATK